MKHQMLATLAVALFLSSAYSFAEEAHSARYVPPAKPRNPSPGDAGTRAASPRFLLPALTREEVSAHRAKVHHPVGQSRELPKRAVTGQWLRNREGRALWSTVVRAEGARGMRVHFTNFDVGTGQVWIHDGNPEAEGQGHVFGPYTGKGILGDGDFWTELTGQDAIWIEYAPAADSTEGEPPFTVKEVFHLWDPNQVHADQNQSCFLDEMCYGGNAFVGSFSQAAAMLIFANGSQCSGTMLNDMPGSYTPYLLTAGHCVLNADDARGMVAVFQYQTLNCGGPVLFDYSWYPQVSGATLLNRSLDTPDGGTSIIMDQPDFAFVQLSGLPWVGNSFMGWSTTTPGGSDRLTSVSHPRGRAQSIAVGQMTDSSNQYFYTIHMNQGAVDHGSSGSGLSTDNDQLVAVDSNGPDEGASGNTICDVSTRDFGFTKFSAIYPYIQKWLDPSKTRTATLSPTSFNFYAQRVSTTSASQTATFTNTGSGYLNLSAAIDGANTDQFPSYSTCGVILEPGASCTVTGTFKPTATGARSASITIGDDASGGPHVVHMSGTGVNSGPTVVAHNTAATTGIVNGACQVPPTVTSFAKTANDAWVYFEMKDVLPGDAYHISFIKPDGTLYVAYDTDPGYQCYSYRINVLNSPPAQLPGNWSVRVTWNNKTLFTNGFSIIP